MNSPEMMNELDTFFKDKLERQRMYGPLVRNKIKVWQESVEYLYDQIRQDIGDSVKRGVVNITSAAIEHFDPEYPPYTVPTLYISVLNEQVQFIPQPCTTNKVLMRGLQTDVYLLCEPGPLWCIEDDDDTKRILNSATICELFKQVMLPLE